MKYIVSFIERKIYKVPVEAGSYEEAQTRADMLLTENPESYCDDIDWFLEYVERKCVNGVLK